MAARQTQAVCLPGRRLPGALFPDGEGGPVFIDCRRKPAVQAPNERVGVFL